MLHFQPLELQIKCRNTKKFSPFFLSFSARCTCVEPIIMSVLNLQLGFPWRLNSLLQPAPLHQTPELCWTAGIRGWVAGIELCEGRTPHNIYIYVKTARVKCSYYHSHIIANLVYIGWWFLPMIMLWHLMLWCLEKIEVEDDVVKSLISEDMITVSRNIRTSAKLGLECYS